MKTSGAILPIGIVLLLSAPVIALTPLFTPPPNGCPCPQGLDVTTPFTNVAVAVGIVGTVLIAYTGVRQRSTIIPTSGPMNNRMRITAAFSGIVVLIAGMILSQIDLIGPGWSILPYSAQGFYLQTLGLGVLFFAGFSIATRSKMGPLFLSVGIILCGLSLLFTYGLSSDFSTRCFPDVGCSPILATSTVSDMIELGYVLAIGAFLLALGLAISFSSRRGSIRQNA
jgi:hypothetical protein